MAIRGWWKGFILQAIHLGGLVACVYTADPVRDLVKDHARQYLPTIAPDLLDRLLWWSSAVACYVVMVGVATLLVKSVRRRPYFEPDLNRNDQLAGLLLGAAKGTVVAVFLATAIETYALDYVKGLPWAADHAKGSMALEWNKLYRPVPWIWGAPPVQHYVSHIRRMGLQSPTENAARQPAAEPSGKATEPASVQTASRPPRMALPAEDQTGSPSEVARAIDKIEHELKKLEPRN
jgi:hypothetical protein